MILLCGHYEGIDERVLQSEVDEEISIGDYVLTNGCLAAIVLVDAVSRFIPDFLGHDDAAMKILLRKEYLIARTIQGRKIFEGKRFRRVLLSGHHKQDCGVAKAGSVGKDGERVRPRFIEEM